MKYNEIIINQMYEEQKLVELDNQFCNLTERYKYLIGKIPYGDILHQYGEKITDNNIDNIFRIKELYFEDREKFNKIILDFNKYPEYKESEKILNLRDEVKYKFFEQFFKYIDLLNSDRMKLFSEEYKKKINFLADKGYFLFHYHLSDESINYIDNDKLEEYLINIYTQNNCQLLKYYFSEIFSLQTFNSKLQNDKINDLKEAVSCLINKSYNSCSRTMFALLENEHYKTSEFKNITSGKERSNMITNLVNRLDIEYYKNMWDKMNAFYKQCNLSMKNQGDNLNRNDLMHGGYFHVSTCGDCLKLILLYINMKNIRYVLNNFNLFIEELTNDASLYLYKIIE